MKAFQTISKIIIIIALIAMCAVIIFVKGPADEIEGLVFDPLEKPDFASCYSFVNPQALPTDPRETVELAAKMYKIANDNMLTLDKWSYMINYSTMMYLFGGDPIPVAGNRFVLKNSKEYYFTEYAIPVGDAGSVAALFSRESSEFAQRSYCDLTKMDFMYAEKSYAPVFIPDEETGKNVITPNWDAENMVPLKKWKKERPVPVFHPSQVGTYAQTTMIINANTIKTADIKYNKTKEGNYYTLTLELDVNVPETTEIALVELRANSGFDKAAYTSLFETIEIWENGYFRFFRSEDKWSAAGFLSSLLDFNTYFYYDDSHTDPSTFLDFPEAKEIALNYIS